MKAGTTKEWRRRAVNLTLKASTIRKARKLAGELHRPSVSNLVEFLIEREQVQPAVMAPEVRP